MSSSSASGSSGARSGHYFVQIADADHVFFEYTAKENSNTVGALFRGFSGYVQADAKSVYDLLFKPPDQRPLPDDGEPDLRKTGLVQQLRSSTPPPPR